MARLCALLPELMYLACTKICTSLAEVVEALRERAPVLTAVNE